MFFAPKTRVSAESGNRYFLFYNETGGVKYGRNFPVGIVRSRKVITERREQFKTIVLELTSCITVADRSFFRFEESVSLMSAESLSQETSSGNFDGEKPAPKTIARADSSGSSNGTSTHSSSSGPVAAVTAGPRKKVNSAVKAVGPAAGKTELAKRTSSFRTPQPARQRPAAKVAVAASVKPAAKTTDPRPAAPVVRAAAPRPVERSSSKGSSLRSSRSSLNSLNSSTSTVKRIPGIGTYTRAIDHLTTELHRGAAGKPKSDASPQPHNRNGSGGGIAVPVGKPRPSSAAGSKENRTVRPGSKPLGFMRPTASSTAKDLIDGNGKPVKPLVKKNFK